MWPQESTLHTRSHSNPVFPLCCKEGKVKLPPRREPPDFLKELLHSSTPRSRHFREAIRIYNAMFSFISLGGKVDRGINAGGGVYVYSISGQIYHNIGSLLPEEGQPPKFAQLYIHESRSELQNRLQLFPADDHSNPLRPEIVQGLQDMLDNNNVLVQTFRMARQRMNEAGVQEVKIKLFANHAHDGREYDLPTGNDVATLIVDETGQDTFQPDIIVQYKCSKLERINFHHPSLMALQYPLLFPYGEDGWHPGIPCIDDEENLWNDNTLSQCDYYAYRLQTRFDQSNALLLTGKLFQQYVVNAYALVEAERLEWIRNNQSKLRAHYVSGLLNAFLRGDSDLDLTGKHVILAASHTGSPRYKYENFQDAMAICRWLGYPDLFITFTCNANWPEIQFMVDLINSDGRKDINRSDIIARVFKLKLHQLMSEIKDKKFFGQQLDVTAATELFSIPC
ncbi:unnamed protein product [Linum trigynum]|uniref:Helitron helicase-like domain-containing protein n=1 Tax=Linum trigynum TaxID=586398 RepID=A0AAV2CF33_9ROSI